MLTLAVQPHHHDRTLDLRQRIKGQIARPDLAMRRGEQMRDGGGSVIEIGAQGGLKALRPLTQRQCQYQITQQAASFTVLKKAVKRKIKSFNGNNSSKN